MSTNFERIVSRTQCVTKCAWPLHDIAHTRQLEEAHLQADGQPSLMQTAGLALARLCLALAPHAKTIWVACGPGNNGGDGLEAARHLHGWGKQVRVTLIHDAEASPADARRAYHAARVAGVPMHTAAPEEFDVCIDALFGIGATRPIESTYAIWAARMNAARATVIAVDIPSGLDADRGVPQPCHVRADYTLSLLTLKPGLFTADGRDLCGEVWFHGLNLHHNVPPQVWLSGLPESTDRPHGSHKGSYGDVAIVGGAPGMTGAALLAGRSALHAGAGRVYVCLLDTNGCTLDASMPELMFRAIDAMDWSAMAVVAGCGGGQTIARHLSPLIKRAQHLVLDADALNHLAGTPELRDQMIQRPPHTTAMTPHPLEAARMLETTVAQVQANRLEAAQTLADRYQCTVALKGSGTIVAAPGETPYVNPTGNAKLASAGTGDVLAGLVGAYLAQGIKAREATCRATYQHGKAAENWQGTVLNASELCQQF